MIVWAPCDPAVGWTQATLKNWLFDWNYRYITQNEQDCMLKLRDEERDMFYEFVEYIAMSFHVERIP